MSFTCGCQCAFLPARSLLFPLSLLCAPGFLRCLFPVSFLFLLASRCFSPLIFLSPMLLFFVTSFSTSPLVFSFVCHIFLRSPPFSSLHHLFLRFSPFFLLPSPFSSLLPFFPPSITFSPFPPFFLSPTPLSPPLSLPLSIPDSSQARIPLRHHPGNRKLRKSVECFFPLFLFHRLTKRHWRGIL